MVVFFALLFLSFLVLPLDSCMKTNPTEPLIMSTISQASTSIMTPETAFTTAATAIPTTITTPTTTATTTPPTTTVVSTSTSTSTSSSTSTSTSTTATTTQPICPSDWTLHQNGRGEWSCYVTVSGPLDSCGIPFGCDGFIDGCDAARMACQALSAELVSIFSMDDNDLVYGLSNPGGTAPFTSNVPGYGTIATRQTCIGLRDSTETGSTNANDYQWPDGTQAIPYSNWASGTPDSGIAQDICVTILTSMICCLNEWVNYPCELSMRNGVCMQDATLITV